ncbi:hypothetical protein IFR05_014808 [Cadophora sp. M221]|nr:hypothetical protein IFR05_014808 [Cadophora sp. M221]
MASRISTMLSCLKLSRLRTGSSQTASSKPLYSPLSSVAPRRRPSGKQKDLKVPRDLIRLLKILPGSAPNIVDCELLVVRLDKAPPYEALSYVWGNPELLDHVICNGQRKSVTINLGIALKHLRLQDETRLIWVDALCINQEDVDERSSQIKLMRDIYTRTWRVVVWLGEDPEGKAEGAISFLQMVADECSRQLQVPVDEIALKDLLKIPFVVLWDAETSVALAQLSNILTIEFEKNVDAAAWLCSHSWFGRVWVIQEVAFAPAMIHVGAQQVAWEVVALSATLFSIRKRIENLDHRRAFVQVKDMFVIEDVVGHSYIGLLQRVVPFEATDPRDKLFAILGLCEDEDRLNPDFQPDYSKDVVEVYTIFARCMAERTFIGLAYLYPHFPDPYTTSGNHFPSWVPRWDQGKISPGQSISMLPSWNVSGDTVAIVNKAIDPKTLSIKGFRLSPAKLVHHGLHRDPQNVSIVKQMWDSINKCIEVGDLPTLAEEGFGERFMQTITAGAVFDSSRRHSEKGCIWGVEELHNYFDFINLSVAGKLESILPENMAKARQLCVMAMKKAFFILEDGQIGLGPNATEPKDIVCVFYGHRMPYILRPVGDGRYLFLGPCFVHGIMHREAMEGLIKGKYREEWLHLC